MNNWIRKRTIIIIIAILLIYGLFHYDGNQTWGFNKTVNWYWDLTNINWWITLYLWPTILVAYGLLAAFKIKTNLVLSGIQILLLVLILVDFRYNLQQPNISFILELIAVIVLIINASISVRKNTF